MSKTDTERVEEKAIKLALDVESNLPRKIVQDRCQKAIQEIREEEWKRCVDLLDHDHKNAQSDLMNNPPRDYK